MEKIELTKEEKDMLFAVNKGDNECLMKDFETFSRLRDKGFLTSGCKTMLGIAMFLTTYGKDYLSHNPKLKNPSICDNKVFVIGTSLTIIGILTRIIIAILKN
ncbi:MAG: hypothetical protein SNJ29_08635 [Rikenellaceae bacterium]